MIWVDEKIVPKSYKLKRCVLKDIKIDFWKQKYVVRGKILSFVEI